MIDVTFLPNKKYPIYNWIYFKEGFSRDFVCNILSRISPKFVLDPFCGVGTTLLACKEYGIDACGFDVLPICVFASKVKTKNYNLDELKNEFNLIKTKKFVRYNISCLRHISRFFNKHVLEDIIFFKSIVKNLKNHEFFLLALINTAIKCSYVYKDGAVLRVRKKPIPLFRKYYFRVIKKMLKDLEKISFKPCLLYVDYGDARYLKIKENSVDCIITSPPYFNKIEYKKVYAIENYLLNKHSEAPLRSFIGNASTYFQDMKKVIKEFARVCNKNAYVFMVIGDGIEKMKIVRVPEILNKFAEKIGFKILKTDVVNRRIATTPTRRKIGILRECILTWRKFK